MVKRTTALFFLSMAYLIIMAHAVIPHHHHQESICIQKTNCSTQQHNHEQSTSEHDHEDDCLLIQSIVIPAGQERYNNMPESDIHWQFDYGMPSDIEHHITSINGIISPLIPDPESSYLHFASAALVLRAPPIA
jgi:hypothetical protein